MAGHPTRIRPTSGFARRDLYRGLRQPGRGASLFSRKPGGVRRLLRRERMDDRAERPRGDRLGRTRSLMDRFSSASYGLRARRRRFLTGFLLAVVFATLPERSAIRGEDWIQVASGVDYQAYELAGPIRAFVARLAGGQPRVPLATRPRGRARAGGG